MEDFNEYSKRPPQGMDENLFSLVSGLAEKFDGKDKNELLKAIYEQAKKGKMNGTLTNAEIDNFAYMLTPLLDDKQKKLLNKVVAELKRL